MYSRLQRAISYLLIFSILTLETVHVPFLDRIRADAPALYREIISIIVPATIYQWAVRDRIDQYSRDVQAKLANTRVSVYTIRDNALPRDIATLLEKLYYSGDNRGFSRLIGAILVGEVPLPIVHKDDKTFPSIYPYVNFTNKAFVYNAAKGYYEFDRSQSERVDPDIWHALIRPNTGDRSLDQQKLIAFFDKTHDYYRSQGIYASGSIEASPSVFVLDSFHDEQSTSMLNWKAYNAYLENVEDFAYFRFDKHFSKRLYDKLQGDTISDLASAEIPGLTDYLSQYGISSLTGGLGLGNTTNTTDFASVPDIQTRQITTRLAKRFPEILNPRYLTDWINRTRSLGRYSSGSQTQADIVPLLIAKQDALLETALRWSNSVLESRINDIVKRKLSRNIAILDRVEVTDASTRPWEHSSVRTRTLVYKNRYFGRLSEEVQAADQCTIMRGSSESGGVLVEANRGYNPDHAYEDFELLKVKPNIQTCVSKTTSLPLTQSFWGWNSPLNYNITNYGNATLSWTSFPLKLNANTYTGFTLSIYDIAGSKEVASGSVFAPASPLDCYHNDALLEPYRYTYVKSSGDSVRTSWPINVLPQDPYHTCDTENKSFTVTGSFDEQYLSGTCLSFTCSLGWTKLFYRSLPSWILHTSPTSAEFNAEVASIKTPSLPVDRVRYVDYVNAHGNYERIDYPNLFSIHIDTQEDLTFEHVRTRIKSLLDAKSLEINTLAVAASPTLLTGSSLSLYQYHLANSGSTLSGTTASWLILSGAIDLYADFSRDPKMLDYATEYILWNNLNSITAKYAFVLEHFLDDDGNVSFNAAYHKKNYEMAVLGGFGDAQNMIVKVDPTLKWDPDPMIVDIQSKNAQIAALVDGSNAASSDDGKGSFKCGSSKWVNIFQWLPAIFCWLGTLVPPVAISTNQCSGSNLADLVSDEEDATDPKNLEDLNNNGVLDGYERILSGSIDLSSERTVYPYSTTVSLSGVLLDDQERRIAFDNFNTVDFKIDRIYVFSGSTNELNRRLVYDRYSFNPFLSNTNIIARYVNFQNASVRAQQGIAGYAFSTLSTDCDVVISASVSPLDKDDEPLGLVRSDPLTIAIRGDRLRAVASVREDADSSYIPSSTIVAGNPYDLHFTLAHLDRNNLPLNHNTPYHLSVSDSISHESFFSWAATVSRDGLSLFKKSSVLNRVGTYRFTWTDSRWLVDTQEITVLPAPLDTVTITPASLISVIGAENYLAVKLLDQFGNLIKGSVSSVTAEVVAGRAIFSDSNTSTSTKQTVDGMLVFPFSSNTVGEVTIKISARSWLATRESTINNLRIIDFAKLRVNIENSDAIIAGGSKHNVTLTVLDRAGNLLSGYDGFATIDFPQSSGVFSDNFITIKDWKNKAPMSFTPGIAAARNLPITVDIPGITEREGVTLTVHPDFPIRVALSKDEPIVEAKNHHPVVIQATLLDRFGNTADYQTDGMSVRFAVPEKYGIYGYFSSGSTHVKEVVGHVSNGSARAVLRMSDLPWRPTVLATVEPPLESRSFSIVQQVTHPGQPTTTRTVTVRGVSTNVLQFNSVYLLNASKLEKITYNSFYTTLLGAPYGDVTTPHYLAGELLFQSWSRALWVTSLLADPTIRNSVMSFSPSGKYFPSLSSDAFVGLKADFVSTQSGTYISITNDILRENIAHVWLNLDPSRTSVLSCPSSSVESIEDCTIPLDRASITLKSTRDTVVVPSGNGVALYAGSDRLFRIDASGFIEKSPGITLDLDGANAGNYLGVRIMANDSLLGYLGYRFLESDDGVIRSVRSKDLHDALSANKSQLVFELLSSRYETSYAYVGQSSARTKGITLSLIDESTANRYDPLLAGPQHINGFEQYSREAGIGFGESNKTLLEMAAGNTLGNATKYNTSYLTVTLGDPVFDLPRIERQRDYDRSIGQRIYRGDAASIESYVPMNFNGDSRQDVAVFLDNGNVDLLANYGGSFRSMGSIISVADAGKWRKAVANFRHHDGYDSIVMVSQKWDLILIDNVLGKFGRVYPKILDMSGALAPLRGAITQLVSFDMDRDGVDDIITLDDAGDLSILYGSIGRINEVSTNEVIFQKKPIDEGISIALSPAARTDGGALYFEWLRPQIPEIENFRDSSAWLAAQTSRLLANATGSSLSSQSLEPLLKRKIYYQTAFPIVLTGALTDAQRRAILLQGVGWNFSQDASGNIIDDYSSGSVTSTGIVGGFSTGALNTASGSFETVRSTNASSNGALADSLLGNMSQVASKNRKNGTDYSQMNRDAYGDILTFVRSPFVHNKGVILERRYRDINGGSLQSGDRVSVTIKLSNTGSAPIRDVIYLDSFDRRILTESKTPTYRFAVSGSSEVLIPLERLESGEFDYVFRGFDIPALGSVTISYETIAIPVWFGKLSAGVFESDDIYGDILFDPNQTCPPAYILWKSIPPTPRSYSARMSKTLANNERLPDALAQNQVDLNHNGVPDYIDTLTASGGNNREFLEYSKRELASYNDSQKVPDSNPDHASIVSYDSDSGEISFLGLGGNKIDSINSSIDSLLSSLCNGFGWGGCITTPVNWAPLAPWSSPVFMGYPIIPVFLQPNVGIPTFSMFTGIGVWPFCIPTVWPASILNWDGCFMPGAGGWLGAYSATNIFRLFITPTITGAIGFAFCFGGPSMIVGNIIAPGISPLVPGWNCIVAAKPMFGCSGGGSDGDAGSIGLGYQSNFLNANQCRAQTVNNGISSQDLASYAVSGNPSSIPSGFSEKITQWGGFSLEGGPLIGIGLNSGGESDFDVSLDGTALKNFDWKNVVKIDLKRVSAFPDFLMDWLTRQVEEIVNKLTTLPNLYIILPDFSGLMDSGWNNFSKNLKNAFNKWKDDYNNRENAQTSLASAANSEASARKAYNDEAAKTPPNEAKLASLKSNLDASSSKLVQAKKSATTAGVSSSDINNTVSAAWVKANLSSTASKDYQEKLEALKAKANSLNPLPKWTISGVKAAYEFIGSLPFLSVEEKQLYIRVPWISPEDLDKWIADLKDTIKQWEDEIDDKATKWGALVNDPLKTADSKVIINARRTLASLQENLRVLEEYKRFPEKLQKYIGWKERYMEQILCNIDAIAFFLGSWLKENGKRFKAWVELYILIKAILKSWQLIIDLFLEYKASCTPCSNERYDLKHFILKLISAIIPKIPIIIFPKWPDIILDLHDIRAGLRILMPVFNFRFVPLVLPQLPRLYLPDVPTLTITLPKIPVIPWPPELPDLPDLPSIPLIKLPDLPPPPTIPNLFGAIAAVLKIFKLIMKILCIWNMGIGRFLTPEWRAGTQIAIITERSGPNILDFLFIDIPQISIGFLDAIKVSTHVNLEFDVDFIVAMAEAALGPLNTLSNNLSNSIGNIQIQDIDLTNALPQNVNVKVELDGSTRRELNYGPTKKLEAPLVHYVKGVVNGFLDLTSFMRSHSSEEVSVDGMREILRSNIVLLQSFGDARATSIANEIKTAVAYNGAREDAIIASMTKESQERFDALRSLIKDESEKTKLLKQAIDDAYSTREATLSPLLGYDESDAILASDRISVSPNIERINASNERIITSLENLITHPDDPDRSAIQTLGSNIKKNVSDGLLAFGEEYQQQERLLADITPASSSLTPSLSGASLSTALASPSASSSSKYVYEGIYYRDSALGQTLLTDYTKEYDGSESVVTFRRDGPSQTNEDVIVRVGDSLYLKEHLNATDRLSPVHETGDPVKQSLDSVVGITSEVSLPLSSPSSFSEVSSAPGQVTFSFRPFDQEHDRTFRLEYEETPTRFDEKEASIDRTTPTSRRRVYDLAVDDLNEDVVTIHPGGIIEKKYAHITDAQGAGIVRMRSWVSHQHTFTLNAGDTLYSLDGNVRALVRSVSSKSSTPFTFAKGASYVMSETTEIRITWNSVLFTLSDVLSSTPRDIPDLRSLIDLPLHNGLQISLEKPGAHFDGVYADGSVFRFEWPSRYEYDTLGAPRDIYTVSIDDASAWYYARLSTLRHGEMSAPINLRLLSPQSAADKTGPLLSFEDSITIPIYSTQTFDLSGSISDISGIERVYLDADVNDDEDGDGIPDNDDSLRIAGSSSPDRFGIRATRDIGVFRFGPYTQPFARDMLVFAEDMNGNISSRDLRLVVTTPSIEISSATGWFIRWKIGDKLPAIPVDILRMRGGILERMTTLNNEVSPSRTLTGGIFVAPYSVSASGIILRDLSGSVIAEISDTRGTLHLLSSDYSLQALSTTKTRPLSIQVLTRSWMIVYTQEYHYPSNMVLEDVSDFSDILSRGIYVQTEPGYRFVRNSNNAPDSSLPLGGYIVDDAYDMIAALDPTGDIYIASEIYHLVPATEDGYPVFRIVDNVGTTLASVIFHREGEYVKQ